MIITNSFDIAQDHYQAVSAGWDDVQWLYAFLIHANIKYEKIWTKYDGTEYSIPEALIDLGVFYRLLYYN
jgi:XisI protein